MNELVNKAVLFAFKAHKGQKRKGGGTPYILHPVEVLSLAATITDDEDILCACVLHDTVEDTDTSIIDIRKEFNDRVARLVFYDTEDKHTELPPEATWKMRKADTIKVISEAKEIGGKIVCLCDKVSNLRSFNQLKMAEGEKMWEHFNQRDPLMHYWYYKELEKALIELKDTTVYKEYCFLVESVFGSYVKE